MTKIFKNKKKSRKIDFFDVVRYFGFACLLFTFFVWGFGSFDNRWVARALFAIAILFNFVYHQFIYKKVRDMEKRG